MALCKMIFVHENRLEFLFAIVTRPSPVNCVILSMMVHTTLHFKGFTTDITDECVPQSMSGFVLLKVAIGSKCFVAALKIRNSECGTKQSSRNTI